MTIVPVQNLKQLVPFTASMTGVLVGMFVAFTATDTLPGDSDSAFWLPVTVAATLGVLASSVTLWPHTRRFASFLAATYLRFICASAVLGLSICVLTLLVCMALGYGLTLHSSGVVLLMALICGVATSCGVMISYGWSAR
jgi:hypothetical protein